MLQAFILWITGRSASALIFVIRCRYTTYKNQLSESTYFPSTHQAIKISEMCLFHSQSKPSSLKAKEIPPSVVNLTSASPRSSGVTGKRRSNQTLANPNPNPQSGSNRLSSTSLDRSRWEESRLPMPRKTPGGLPQDPVILGAPTPADQSGRLHQFEAAGQAGTFLQY